MRHFLTLTQISTHTVPQLNANVPAFDFTPNPQDSHGHGCVICGQAMSIVGYTFNLVNGRDKDTYAGEGKAEGKGAKAMLLLFVDINS